MKTHGMMAKVKRSSLHADLSLLRWAHVHQVELVTGRAIQQLLANAAEKRPRSSDSAAAGSAAKRRVSAIPFVNAATALIDEKPQEPLQDTPHTQTDLVFFCVHELCCGVCMTPCRTQMILENPLSSNTLKARAVLQMILDSSNGSPIHSHYSIMSMWICEFCFMPARYKNWLQGQCHGVHLLVAKPTKETWSRSSQD